MSTRDPIVPVLTLRLGALLAVGLSVSIVAEDVLVWFATIIDLPSHEAIFPNRIWSALVLVVEDHATRRESGAQHVLAWLACSAGCWLLVARGRAFAALCRRVSRCTIAPGFASSFARSASC